MKNTLSMKTNVPDSATSLPSAIDMAKNLHQFEIDQRNKTIEDLQQQIDKASGEHQQQIVALQNTHQEKLKAQRDSFSLAVEAVEVNSGRDDEKLKQLQHYSDQLALAGDALGAEKDRLQEETQQLQQQLKTAIRVADTAQQKQKELEAELKALKALNPERMAKQIKELKQTKTEKTDAITKLRKDCRALKADNKAKAHNIGQLDIALAKACNDLNEQNTPEPLESINLGGLGYWEIHGDDRMNHYNILDKANNVSLGVEVINDALHIPEVRNIPKSITTRILKIAAHNQKNEAAIAISQKPLNQQSKEA